MEVTEKHWGYEKLLYLGEYAMKILCVNPGKSLSKQYHKKKVETMWVSSGVGKLHLEDGVKIMSPGRHFNIASMEIHRVENIGSNDLIIVEASTIELWDVERLEIYE